MTLYTILVRHFMDLLPHTVFKEAGAVAYGSAVLGLLLVFRTNTAYERWNDGRKLWGQLVNDSRNFCFKVRSFTTAPELERIRMGQLVISFAYALKHHLRGTLPSEPLPGLGRSSHEIKNLPVHVCGNIFDMLKAWKQAGYIDTLVLIQLDFHVRAFMDVCGGCERIKNSPIAVSYRAFMRQGIVMNLLIAPMALAMEFPLEWCLPIILLGTYFLIGLELIAEDIEEPFGKDGDDLPLDTICATIRTTITDILSLHRAFKYTRTADVTFVDPLKQTK
jgi:putative membrane protein